MCSANKWTDEDAGGGVGDNKGKTARGDGDGWMEQESRCEQGESLDTRLL